MFATCTNLRRNLRVGKSPSILSCEGEFVNVFAADKKLKVLDLHIPCRRPCAWASDLFDIGASSMRPKDSLGGSTGVFFWIFHIYKVSIQYKHDKRKLDKTWEHLSKRYAPQYWDRQDRGQKSAFSQFRCSRNLRADALIRSCRAQSGRRLLVCSDIAPATHPFQRE